MELRERYRVKLVFSKVGDLAESRAEHHPPRHGDRPDLGGLQQQLSPGEQQTSEQSQPQSRMEAFHTVSSLAHKYISGEVTGNFLIQDW